MHEQECPVWPLAALRAAFASEGDDTGTHGSAWKKMRQDRRPWWVRHPSEFGFNCDAEPLVVDMSSPVCTDWSMAGNMQGEAGMSQGSHMTYIAKRRVAAKLELEHLFFFECTPRYPISTQTKELSETHDIVYIVWSPVKGGFPTVCRRLFAAGVARWSHVWVGPPQGEIQSDFARAFGRSLAVDGDCFFFSQDRRPDLLRRASGPLPEGWEAMPVQNLLPYIATPHANSRWGEWNRMFEQRRRRPHHDQQPAAFLGDVDHFAGRGSCGRMFPVQMRHHTIYSWTQDAIATDVECWAALGVDSASSICGGRAQSPVHQIVKTMPAGCQQRLRGNSMHVPTVGQWLVYVLSNIVPRKTTKRCVAWSLHRSHRRQHSPTRTAADAKSPAARSWRVTVSRKTTFESLGREEVQSGCLLSLLAPSGQSRFAIWATLRRNILCTMCSDPCSAPELHCACCTVRSLRRGKPGSASQNRKKSRIHQSALNLITSHIPPGLGSKAQGRR